MLPAQHCYTLAIQKKNVHVKEEIFDNKTTDWDVIFDLTFHRLTFWLKSFVKNFSYTDSDLYRNPECIMNWTN